MARETGIQSQVESYQRLRKRYLMQPCLTQHYKVRIKGEDQGLVEKSPKRSSPLLNTPVLWLLKMEPSGRPRLRSASLHIFKDIFGMATLAILYIYIYIYIWTLTKRLEKKLDGNYTRMFTAILNKSWRQHPTRHQLYSHLPPITKTIQVRRTRHAGHCWRSKDELISDVLL